MGAGMDSLYDDPALQLIGFDVYATPLTQFVADGHQIPLTDQSADAVWVQAVLEHVLNPWHVVEEIYRVLKPEGVVYAETPFMQQVHEGAYDFTRFTESGHRWLFRKFDLIDSGAIWGPGEVLLWTIGYASRGIFRSRRAASLARTLFFWVRYIDKLIPERYVVDSASGVYFMGRKSQRELAPQEIVRHYKGTA